MTSAFFDIKSGKSTSTNTVLWQVTGVFKSHWNASGSLPKNQLRSVFPGRCDDVQVGI